MKLLFNSIQLQVSFFYTAKLLCFLQYCLKTFICRKLLQLQRSLKVLSFRTIIKIKHSIIKHICYNKNIAILFFMLVILLKSRYCRYLFLCLIGHLFYVQWALWEFKFFRSKALILFRYVRLNISTAGYTLTYSIFVEIQLFYFKMY